MKIFTGKVISKRMQKTATVLVERKVSHPVYLKLMKRTRKYHVHDEVDVKVGDAVRFVATKPVSKLKKWKIIGVVGGLSVKSPVKEGKKRSSIAKKKGDK